MLLLIITVSSMCQHRQEFHSILPLHNSIVLSSAESCMFAQLTVTVIANLACTPEGCLLLLRSSLLPKTEQQLHQLLQRKDSVRTAAMLRPLIHLTAHHEGQKQILRSTAAPGADTMTLCAL